MLTSDELASLEKGDAIEIDPLLPAVSKEPTRLVVVKNVEGAVHFVAQWHGVTLGAWIASVSAAGEVTWVIR